METETEREKTKVEGKREKREEKEKEKEKAKNRKRRDSNGRIETGERRWDWAERVRTQTRKRYRDSGWQSDRSPRKEILLVELATTGIITLNVGGVSY